MRRWIPALVLILALTACQPQPTSTPSPTPTPTPEPIQIQSSDNPYAPSLDDARLSTGTVTFSSANLLVMAAHPDQIALSLNGSLPNPCHQLRIRVLPFTPGSGRVDVEAYSVVDKDQICERVLKLFNENVPIGRFPPGLYELYLNGALVGTFNGSN